MDTIIQHIEQNIALYVVAVVFAAPLLYLFRKQTLPVIYHGVEYIIYCVVVHYFIGGVMRVASWYQSETSFRNTDGSLAKEFTPFTTPLNLHFWEKELYHPQWFFYVEAVMAVLLLYLVIFIRPTRFKRNVYTGRREQPQKKTSVRQPGLTSRMRTDAQRARLQRVRDNR